MSNKEEDVVKIKETVEVGEEDKGMKGKKEYKDVDYDEESDLGEDIS